MKKLTHTHGKKDNTHKNPLKGKDPLEDRLIVQIISSEGTIRLDTTIGSIKPIFERLVANLIKKGYSVSEEGNGDDRNEENRNVKQTFEVYKKTSEGREFFALIKIYELTVMGNQKDWAVVFHCGGYNSTEILSALKQ